MNLATTKVSLTEQCYDHIRKLIIDGEIEAGVRFNENGLIERIGFGRTPVREALARLDMEGIIQTQPRSGYQLCKIDLAAVEDHFLAWTFVGPITVRKAAEHISDIEKQRIKQCAHDLLAGDDLDEWLGNSAEIFDILAKATQSSNLQYMNRRLSCQMHRIYGHYFNSERGARWRREDGTLFLRDDWNADPELAEMHMKVAVRKAHIEIRKMFSDVEP